MRVEFEDEDLGLACNSAALLVGWFGSDVAPRIRRRLTAVHVADTIADLQSGPYVPVQLDGRYEGCWAIPVTEDLVLVLQTASQDPDGRFHGRIAVVLDITDIDLGR